MNPLLVTGAAGFIGMHVCERLLIRGQRVVGVDNLNAYYDVALKQARLQRLQTYPGFSFERTDLADRGATAALFERLQPRRVLHRAAQAGVRHSIEYPQLHVDANLVGFANLLEVAGSGRSSTWCMRAAPASTAATRACCFTNAARSTTRSTCTRRARRPTS